MIPDFFHAQTTNYWDTRADRAQLAAAQYPGPSIGRQRAARQGLGDLVAIPISPPKHVRDALTPIHFLGHTAPEARAVGRGHEVQRGILEFETFRSLVATVRLENANKAI